jgi:hypothetical protein
MKEILDRNNKIAEDIKVLIPDTIVNCILIGDTAEKEKICSLVYL